MQNNLAQKDKPLLLGLAGYGTVGSGLARILDENREVIRRRVGRDIRVKSVLVRDPARPRQYRLPEGAAFCADLGCLCDDPDIDVVVELIGGVETAGELEYLMEAGIDLFQGFYIGRPELEIRPLNPFIVEKMRKLSQI